MIDWRQAILGSLVALTLLPCAARADQAFQRFLPLFVDLDGWQGKKPDGMSLDMPNSSMTTATRDYTRGDGVCARCQCKKLVTARLTEQCPASDQ